MSRCLLIALLLASSALAQGAGQTRSTPDVPRLLERYARGEDSVTELARLDPPAWNAFASSFESSALGWMQQAPAGDTARRQRVVAAFAIEAADLVLQSPSRLLARKMFAWICPLMRRAPLDESARAWWVASISALERAEDWDLLLGTGADAELKDGHLTHARAVLGGAPLLDLAEAVGREGRSWSETSANLTAMVRSKTPAQRTTELDRLADAFTALQSHTGISHEASLRLAMTNLRRGKADAGAFGSAARSANDPFVAYVGWLVSGVILQEQGSADAALLSYKRALEAAPRAQSAGAMLVALLASRGAIDEARDQAETLLAGPAAPDPWRQYRLGAGRSWPQIRQALKENSR